jgi:hypothetical protein
VAQPIPVTLESSRVAPCPLCFFKLFIDRVEAWLKNKAPQGGKRLGAELLLVLFCAAATQAPALHKAAPTLWCTRVIP